MITLTYVTVTYNAANVLQRTLDSVLAQDYGPIEHIIIDGGSTDGTLQLVDSYIARSNAAGNSHSIQVTSEPDHGIYDAMNKGLMQASGDYIVYMNAGDCFPQDDTLEQVMRRCRLSEYPSDGLPGVLYGLTDIVDGEGRYLRPRRLQPPAQLHWRSFRHGMLVCHQAFYARTDIAKNLQYDLRYRFSADVDWCIRVMRESERMGLPLSNIGIVVANYTEEGATTKNHKASLKERFDVMRQHYGLLTTMAMHAWFVVRGVIKKK